MKLKPLAGLLGMLLVTSPAYALTEVDTELQLLMDVSGSVSSSEFNLQLQGYVDAFYSQGVHRRTDDHVEQQQPAERDD